MPWYIYIGHNKVEKDGLNWYDKIDKLIRLLNTWKSRQLTLMGKIYVIKQLAIPKVLFPASMLRIPHGIIKEINHILFNFIWAGKDRV